MNIAPIESIQPLDNSKANAKKLDDVAHNRSILTKLVER